MHFIHEPNRVYVNDENGRLLAEVTFPEAGKGTVDIVHTFVDPSLRGRGIASELLEHAYDEIKRQGKKTYASCSYAARWFEVNANRRDLLAECES